MIILKLLQSELGKINVWLIILLFHFNFNLWASQCNEHINKYAQPKRGQDTAFQRYLTAMDRTAKAKIGLMGLLMVDAGKVADMGMASGTTTSLMAQAYPHVDFVGVDISEEMVSSAKANYVGQNIEFIQGDISEEIFPNSTMDGIINSSVIHHVTSFKKKHHDATLALGTVTNQAKALKPNGILLIRDFFIPPGPKDVFLDLPKEDKKLSDNFYEQLSSSEFFELFVERFRSSHHIEKAASYQKVEGARVGFQRYLVDYPTAIEFIYHKDFRADFDVEVLEEYAYMSQPQFNQLYEMNQLRILLSRPLYNQWIIENRFENKFSLYDLKGNELKNLPTNFLIVGEKVAPHEGVKIVETDRKVLRSPKFLQKSSWKEIATGKVYDIFKRENPVIDVIPYYFENDQLKIFSRFGYPRPIVNSQTPIEHLTGLQLGGYISEPISLEYKNDLKNLNEMKKHLDKYGLRGNTLQATSAFFPSEGGIAETVNTVFLKLDSPQGMPKSLKNKGTLSTNGVLKSLDAQQALWAYQSGASVDVRLELGIYRLMKSLNYKPSDWIGTGVNLSRQDVTVPVSELKLKTSSEAKSFIETNESGHFAKVIQGTFKEYSASGYVVGEVNLEYMVPKNYSINTMSALPVIKTNEGVFVGIESRKLPTAEIYGRSGGEIKTFPAFRLSFMATDLELAKAEFKNRLSKEFKVKINKISPLGNDYRPSPGVTPETVYPYLVEVDGSELDSSTLEWVRLDELLKNESEIESTSMLLGVFRLSHALGQL